MVFTLDQEILNKIIVIVIIGIIIAGALIGLKLTGIIGGEEKAPDSGVSPSGSAVPVETSDVIMPTQTYRASVKDSGITTVNSSWEYKGYPFRYTFSIKNSTYLDFENKEHKIYPDTMADDIQDYVVYEGDSGVVEGIADYLLEQSRQKGWGDYDTIMNTVEFLHQYSPGSFNTSYSDGMYRYPVETIRNQKGDTEDISILAASIFTKMGYPVAFLVYPEQYDRGSVIEQYPAVAIRSDDDVSGKTYTLKKEEYAGDVTCYPQKKDYSAPALLPSKPGYGYFEGNTTIVFSDGEKAYAKNCTWDIESGSMNYTGGYKLSAGDNPAYFKMSNASWTGEDSYVYIDVLDNTTVPGQVPAELSYAKPEIVTGPADDNNDIKIFQDNTLDSKLTALLRIPSPLEDEERINLTDSLSERLKIPVPVYVGDEVNRINEENRDEYWKDVWYSTYKNFYNQVWYLNIINYEIISNPKHYAKSGELYFTPTGAWRLKYEVTPTTQPDNDVDSISSFSEVVFAVYKVNETTNSADFLSEFSYGQNSGQDTVNYHNFYEAGNFYIAAFVRNCEVKLSVQVHGKGED
ncbi:hypothetical protein J2128_001434 [Methanomicrobium sp. W14]|uniref:hypothetical protein n=1 Tax=Methanomicrobium sp. W14 TaxID=2817839 RepID=UPI001AEAA0D5|nr:hypothetical protein [Methanomicrobium sp. W14]MBP2133480.1 hypothetical protein [Methanomicrobium sp. W14]